MKIKLKKGLRLSLAGALPANATATAAESRVFAIYPCDFPGFVPKVDVKEGEEVACGTAVMHDKNHPEVKLVSPVAGKVKAVVRGERRKVIRIEVEAGESRAESPVFKKPSEVGAIKEFLALSGLLAFMRQRPYDIVPNPSDKVRDIFVTAFDEAPLAPDYSVFSSIFKADDYQTGIDLLSEISEGKVYISHKAGFAYTALKGAEMVEFEGAYPASNAGVQIANISPVDKGDVVWTLDFATVVGPEVEKPSLVSTTCGASIAPILEGKLKSTNRNLRIISGNVFTGIADCADAFIHFPYRQITVIDEGDDVDEFMGWASFSPKKMSESSSFPGRFFSKVFSPDARINGGRRAMIVSGQYDKFMPMDILPEYLIKAILSNNIDDMEKLGIYEVAPEDFAAAEYADTSKLPLQKIVRDGLDNLRKELE